MSEWWTYTLSDFLMFSPATYYRLFELYNREIWPLQLLCLGLGIALLALMQGRGHRHGRVAAAILAGCWLWVAVAFHLHRYATINWAASYFAGFFAVQALLLLWIGVIRGQLVFDRANPTVRRTGFAVVLFGVFVVPLIGFLVGRNWVQGEVFGVAPDPTAIATLGVLLAASGRVFWELLIIPLLWCAISGATLLAMRSADAPVPTLLMLVALLLAAWKKVSPRLR